MKQPSQNVKQEFWAPVPALTPAPLPADLTEGRSPSPSVSIFCGFREVDRKCECSPLTCLLLIEEGCNATDSVVIDGEQVERADE